jgi:hypothetical protein
MSFFRTNFEIARNHQISLTEIESMMPFERDFYIGLVNHAVQKENEIMEQQRRKAQYR